MSEYLPCVEINPPDMPPRAAVIWLHGLGANGHDFVPIVPALGLSGVRFVFPHAPEMPVTLNGGMSMPAWYDIKTLEEGPEREDADDIRRAAGWVEALVERELSSGIPPECIVLAGFSQGAAMALHVGARFGERLAGLMVLSGYLLMGEAFEAEAGEANRRAPLLFCHGTGDDIVPIKRGYRARDVATDWAGDEPDLTWHEYPMGHEVCVEEVAVISAWLGRVLGT